ncbi:vegetative cell wall protein gp1-like [Iris pallida]|uniref:Vegetative cell wall protein gp1-like n=1 Tax=Iris pallida TaxID=29817 RepID=A0AAX6GKW5_IRIPA|nr:vegetative cell wall protein gp1-like [Iris pallida]
MNKKKIPPAHHEATKSMAAGHLHLLHLPPPSSTLGPPSSRLTTPSTSSTVRARASNPRDRPPLPTPDTAITVAAAAAADVNSFPLAVVALRQVRVEAGGVEHHFHPISPSFLKQVEMAKKEEDSK